MGDKVFEVEAAVKIQTEQLQRWKGVLKKHVYDELEEWATATNHSVVSGAYVRRGTDLSNFVANFKTPTIKEEPEGYKMPVVEITPGMSEVEWEEKMTKEVMSDCLIECVKVLKFDGGIKSQKLLDELIEVYTSNLKDKSLFEVAKLTAGLRKCNHGKQHNG